MVWVVGTMQKRFRLVIGGALLAAAALVSAQEGPNPKYEPNQLTKAPQVISQARPIYPFSMHRAGIWGEVVVGFVVDPRGRVIHTNILRSSHPAFRQSAVRAVEDWKFEPGEVDGRKVHTRMQVPIVFRIIDGSNQFGWRIKRPASFPPEVPVAYQWDEPPTLLEYAAPVYPREALERNLRGKVTVKFIVDALGRVVAAQGAGPGDAMLQQAAIAAVETFRMEPAKRAGQPCGAILSMEFDFRENNSSDAPVTEEIRRLMRRLEREPETIAELRDLDAIPKAYAQRSPTMPAKFRGKGVEGRAMIEFIINRYGSAFLPRVVEATDPAFGFAAAQAVADWQFAIPLLNDEPTDARVLVPVVFKAASPAAATSSPAAPDV